MEGNDGVIKIGITRKLKLFKFKIKLTLLCRDPTSHKTLKKCSTKREEKRPILEEQPQKNTMEKLGVSDAPTVPVRRRLAWDDTEITNEDIQKQPRQEEDAEDRGRDKQVYMGELEKLEVHEKSKADKIKEG